METKMRQINVYKGTGASNEGSSGKSFLTLGLGAKRFCRGVQQNLIHPLYKINIIIVYTFYKFILIISYLIINKFYVRVN